MKDICIIELLQQFCLCFSLFCLFGIQEKTVILNLHRFALHKMHVLCFIKCNPMVAMHITYSLKNMNMQFLDCLLFSKVHMYCHFH